MDEQIWTFSRQAEQLEIRRTPTSEGYLLGVRGDGPPRTYFFADLGKLESFQNDFERFLLGTGWTFVAYAPDRRTGRERRHFSRLLNDRRRWWTDGMPPSTHHDGHDGHDGRERRRRLRRS